MTNEEIKQEVQDKLFDIIPEMNDEHPITDQESRMSLVDQILSLSGNDWELAIVKKKPELPECPYEDLQGNDPVEIGEYNRYSGYINCQKDIQEAGFRQEIK